MKLFQFLLSSSSAALTCSFSLFTFAMFASGDFKPALGLVLLAAGAVYGIAIRALLSFFPVERWGLLFAGFVVGPVPLTLLFCMQSRHGIDESGRALIWLLLSLLGLFVGVLEWAQVARRERKAEEARL